MSHAGDALLFIQNFPAFNLFSQSNLLKDFHCSFPAFYFFCVLFDNSKAVVLLQIVGRNLLNKNYNLIIIITEAVKPKDRRRIN